MCAPDLPFARPQDLARPERCHVSLPHLFSFAHSGRVELKGPSLCCRFPSSVGLYGGHYERKASRISFRRRLSLTSRSDTRVAFHS